MKGATKLIVIVAGGPGSARSVEILGFIWWDTRKVSWATEGDEMAIRKTDKQVMIEQCLTKMCKEGRNEW